MREPYTTHASHTRTNRRQPATTLRSRLARRVWLGLTAIVLIVCGLTGFAATLGTALLFHPKTDVAYAVVETNHPYYAGSPLGPNASTAPLSTVFTPEVQYWGTLIKAWAVMYQVDPNLIATVIQIESCGDPLVSSNAGAQGLFQVMPFHFADGEDMLDVQTNARRGLTYLLDGLNQADGHVGLALAGYNGGHGVIGRGWAAWSSETRRYYYWGSRIYSEAVSGMSSSATLQEWLNGGGVNLCNRARQSEQQIDQANQANVTARLVQ